MAFCKFCVANEQAVHLHVPSRFKKELKKRKLVDDDYVEGPGGLRISELSEGSGAVVNTGDLVTVRDPLPCPHYVCLLILCEYQPKSHAIAAGRPTMPQWRWLRVWSCYTSAAIAKYFLAIVLQPSMCAGTL